MNESEARRQEGESLRHGEVKCTVDWLVSTMQHRVVVTKHEVQRLNKLFAEQRKDLHHLKEFKEWAKVQLDADRQAFANIQNTSERREVIYDGNKRGWLLGWGGGSGYPVGIVESEHNPIHTPSALNIKFVNWTKGDGDCDGSV